MIDSVERRIFLWCLERDLRATEHMGNLIWLPEKASFEELRAAWREPILDPSGRCIGCGRFLAKSADWNQCGDCDTRSPEGQAYGGSW